MGSGGVSQEPGAGPRSPSRWLWWTFAASLAVRLVVLWSWQRGPFARCLGADPEAFFASARSIANGGWGEPHGLLMGGPVYPYFLAALMLLGGPGTAFLRLAQAVVGALGVTLVAALGARLHSRATGVLAAIAMLLHGPLLASELGFENEFLTVPLVAGALFLLARAVPSRPSSFAAGVLLGLDALVRGNQLLVACLAAIWVLATVRPRRTALSAVAALAGGVALAIVPIAARNLSAVGEPLPLGAHGGYVFYLGHHDGASWRYRPVGFGDTSVEGEVAASIAEARRRTGRALSPGEASSYWLGEGLAFVRDHPGSALRNAGSKLLALFQPDELPDNYDVRFLREIVPPLRPLRLPLPLVFVLAAVALAEARDRRAWLLAIPPATAALTVVGFYYNARFRLPALPFLIALAAEGASSLARRIRDREVRRARAPMLAAGTALILVAAAPTFRDDFYFPLVLLGGCAAEARPGDAEALYRRAMALHPREPEARLGLAQLLVARGSLAPARALLTPLPESAPALLLLASIEERDGRPAEAVTWLEAGLERDPSMPGAWNDLGVLHARAGRTDDARAAFARALALEPGRRDVLRNLALLGLEAGDAAPAVRERGQDGEAPR